jgi:hypothetical protein
MQDARDRSHLWRGESVVQAKSTAVRARERQRERQRERIKDRKSDCWLIALEHM